MADVKKAVKAILERVNTAEKAVALKGKARKEYIKAVEAEFGPVEKRAEQVLGSPDKYAKIKKAHEDLQKKLKENDIDINVAGRYDTKFDDSGEMLEETPIGHIAEATHKKTGKSIGEAPVKTEEGFGNVIDDTHSDVDNQVRVHPEFRRKGVAEGMYAAIEKETGLPMRPSNWQTKEGKALWDDSRTKAFGNKRHPEAVFDPRFKDSDLIMAANKGKKSAVETGLNALSIPQKILMRKTAEAMGIDLGAETGEAGEDADKASEAIVEKAAQKLGIPEDSQLGALAKGAAKTALDIGYDPLSLVPVGKIAKITGKAKILPKILEKLGAGKKGVEKLPSMAEREAAVLKQKMTDISAQAKVDRLKRQRADVRWEKMSEAEKEKVLKETMAKRQEQALLEKAESEARMGKTAPSEVPPRRQEWIAEEQKSRRELNARLKAEKEAELQKATESAKQDVINRKITSADEDITQVGGLKPAEELAKEAQATQQLMRQRIKEIRKKK